MNLFVAFISFSSLLFFWSFLKITAILHRKVKLGNLFSALIRKFIAAFFLTKTLHGDPWKIGFLKFLFKSMWKSGNDGLAACEGIVFYIPMNLLDDSTFLLFYSSICAQGSAPRQVAASTTMCIFKRTNALAFWHRCIPGSIWSICRNETSASFCQIIAPIHAFHEDTISWSCFGNK